MTVFLQFGWGGDSDSRATYSPKNMVIKKSLSDISGDLINCSLKNLSNFLETGDSNTNVFDFVAAKRGCSSS